MTWLWWLIIGAFLLTGLIGTVVPGLPGHPLILAGALVHRLAFGAEAGMGWTTLAGLALLTLLAIAVDFAGGTLGARWSNASRYGVIGALAGGVAGIFFGLPGLIAGPLLGAVVGEFLAGRRLRAALQSAGGTLLGTAVTGLVRLLLGLAMLLWFILAVTGRW